MNNNELISIIVPVFNTEKFLNRCITSIINQKYKNIEVILVNDGSTDNCPSICESWKNKDSRIKVIHKKNGGLSSARNAGLKIAEGKYIGFVDSDDWIDENMYLKLYTAIRNYNADIAISKIEIVKVNNNKLKEKVSRIEILNKQDMYDLFFRVSKKQINYCVCDKLYNANLIKKFNFTEGIRFEDIDFNYRVFSEANKAIYLNDKLYYWYFNEGNSITRNKVIKKDLQLIDVWKKIYKHCKKNNPNNSYYAKMNYERAFMGILAKAARFGVSNSYLDWDDDKKILLNELRKNYIDLLKWKMPFSRKILLTVLCINPKIISIPYKIFNSKSKCME